MMLRLTDAPSQAWIKTLPLDVKSLEEHGWVCCCIPILTSPLNMILVSFQMGALKAGYRDRFRFFRCCSIRVRECSAACGGNDDMIWLLQWIMRGIQSIKHSGRGTLTTHSRTVSPGPYRLTRSTLGMKIDT